MSLVQCPKCGKDSVSSVGICPACNCTVAIELQKAAVITCSYQCMVCHNSNVVRASDTNCKNCGHPLPRFCPVDKVALNGLGQCERCEERREQMIREMSYKLNLRDMNLCAPRLMKKANYAQPKCPRYEHQSREECIQLNKKCNQCEKELRSSLQVEKNQLQELREIWNNISKKNLSKRGEEANRKVESSGYGESDARHRLWQEEFFMDKCYVHSHEGVANCNECANILWRIQVLEKNIRSTEKCIANIVENK